MNWLRFFRRDKNADQNKLPDDFFGAEENPFPEPIELAITDIIDLHSIPPKEIKTVIEEYLFQAHQRGFSFIRIIHGKGIGVQREATRKILVATPFVKNFSDAPPEAGGWGATIVELRNKAEPISDKVN